MEGIVYPWWGLNYRPDRVQFSLENSKRDKVDHSRESVLHAQKIANLFVYEARLSSNEFPVISEEQQYLNLLANNEAHLVELPLVQSSDENTIRTELYLF